MLLRMDAEGNLYQEGFQECVLGDGRPCLLWARGYFFDPGGRMWLDGEIADWLATQLGAKGLSDLVPAMNGCLSVVVVWAGASMLEVGIDRFGTIPVYYNLERSGIVLSDDYWQVVRSLSRIEYNANAVVSMVLLGYVAGYQTLLQGVSELRQAAVHRFFLDDTGPNLASHRYWMLMYHAGSRANTQEWQEQLSGVVESVFARHSHAILARGLEVYLPLSGGKDSRLIAGMLKRYGAPIHAFSYGPPHNTETNTGLQVAHALGIPLGVVSIPDPTILSGSLIRTMTTRVGMRARFTTGLGAQLSLQGFSEDRVYTPGHTGDLVTGGHIHSGAFLVRTPQQAIRYLVAAHSLSVLDDFGAPLLPKFWHDKIRSEVVAPDWQFDASDPIGSLERWDYEHRQRRLILTELRTYELHGLWLLPFYDYELIDFYSQVPVCLRYQQRLYVRTLIENLFIDDLAALAQIPVASLGPMQPPEATWKDRLLMRGIAAPLSDWLLDRAMHTKRLEHLRSVGARSADPSGPDPLDHWWHEYPEWRRSVRAMFFGWDGMHEIMDVSALLRLLEEPLPRLFVQFGIPAFLTLRFFQELLEGALRNGTLSQVSALQPIPAENTPPEFKINLSGNQPNKYR